MGRKKLSIAKPTIIQTELRPLDESFWIEQNNQLEQWYYQNSGVYAPDRQVTPLQLTPMLSCKDADTGAVLTPSYDTNNDGVRWFVKEWNGSAYVETEVTSTTSTDYYYKSGNVLVVQKNNPDATHAINVRVRAVYIDPRDGGRTPTVEASVILPTSVDATQVYPTLRLNTPSSLAFNPLKDANSTFEIVADADWPQSTATSEELTTYKADPLGTEAVVPNNVSQVDTCIPIMDIRYGDTKITDQRFMSRQTSGGLVSSIPNGIAALTKIQGATQKLVQLLGTTYVDMGLPSGTLWASCDIDITKASKFCETPFTYDKSFFSWGNVDGHNPTSGSSFSPYDWGGVNQSSPYYEGQVYGSTKGNDLTDDIPVGAEYDAACANLGAPWRMPTNDEYGELFNNIIYINADGTEVDSSVTDKRVTVNGIVGIYLQSTINGNRLFFACSGYGSSTNRNSRGSNGFYWCSTWNNARYASSMQVDSSGVSPHNGRGRYSGSPIRPVMSNNNIYTIDGKKYAITDGMALDLTAMGIEDLTSVADVKAWLLNQFGVNTGIPKTEALVSVLLKGIKSVGFNQWDEEWEVGGLDNNTGDTTDQNDRIRSKNFIPCFPNTNHFTRFTNDTTKKTIYVYFYDSSKNYISFLSGCGNEVIVSPANACYMKIRTYKDYGTTYNHDICINISDSSKNGTYEPHWESLTEFDVTKISGIPSGGTEANREIIFPYGLQGIGDIRDVLSVANGVFSAIRRVGSVDLGTGTWNASTDGRGFNSNIVKNSVSLVTGIRHACAKYVSDPASSDAAVVAMSDKHICIKNNGNVFIKDAEYSTTTAFKDSLQGVMLYYELANPVTYHDLKYNGKPMPKIGCFEWYGVQNGQEVPIQNLPCYSQCVQPTGKGQHTDTIKVDAMYGEDIHIVCKLKHYAADTVALPPREYCSVAWKIPPIDVVVVSDKGSAVRASHISDGANFIFSTIVNQQGEVISDEVKEEHMAFNWFYTRYSAEPARALLGLGLTKSVAASTLRNANSSITTGVNCDVYVWGAYELINGSYVRRIQVDNGNGTYTWVTKQE